MHKTLKPVFLKAVLLVAKLDEGFLELASLLNTVKFGSEENFKILCTIPQLGRRKAYYLVAVDRTFGNGKAPPERLVKIGWTKLALLASHVTAENMDDALLFAEIHTAKQIEKFLQGQDIGWGWHSVLLHFTDSQFAAFVEGILAFGAKKNGPGFAGKEEAVVAALAAASKTAG